MITKYQGNQEQIERVLDLLLKVSPDLFLPEGVLKEEGFIFLQLSKVSHYWNLKDVEQPEHALNKLLQHLYLLRDLLPGNHNSLLHLLQKFFGLRV